MSESGSSAFALLFWDKLLVFTVISRLNQLPIHIVVKKKKKKKSGQHGGIVVSVPALQ